MKDMNEMNDKKGFFGKIKASFSGRKFRSGAYVTVISAVVIVIILVANMLVSKMNIQVDLSTQNMYTLSKDTKKMVKNLKDDVTIYYLVEAGKETDIFKNIVKQYDAASDKITVVNKDPVLYPTFAKKYVNDSITENSFLVVDNATKKAKYVDNSSMLIQETNYQTYQTQTTGIDVEGQLTSAIQYVTSKNTAKMYIVQGHGETEIGDTLSTTLDKANITTENLSTLSADSIPKDCSILFINAPQSDFSDAETTMIKNYLTSGGKAIITLNYAANDLKNFKSIIDYYGIEIVKGRVIELDSNMHMSQYVNCLLPNIESHAITTTAKDKQVPVVMVDASGLKISDTKRSTLKVEPLLTTSDSAFSKADINSSSVEKEDGDITGPFNLGICSADTYNNVTSDIVVFSSASTFNKDTASYSNADVLAGAVGFLSGNENTLSIPTKSVLPTQLTLSAKQVYVLTAIAVIIIPIVILILGGIICYKRRKK